MPDSKELKKLERKARSLLLGKDIPPAKMEMVRSMMNNPVIKQEEKYTAIIDLIQNLPDKKAVRGDEIEIRKEKNKKRKPEKDTECRGVKSKPLLGPTETSYYIDELYRKYKRHGIFKKRLLAHRDSRFGIGFRKRLVPTKLMLSILGRIAESHELLIGRLDRVMDTILFDPECDDPSTYNFIAIFRRWLTNVPLIRQKYDRIVWMERKGFDREFRDYISYFYSFYKLGNVLREQIIDEIEKRLRSLDMKSAGQQPGTQKSSSGATITDNAINHFIAWIRFFLPSTLDDANPITGKIFLETGIKSMSDFLMAITEALIYQRPFNMEELIGYYDIVSPIVSSTEWNCGKEKLEKSGKNRSAKLHRELEALRTEIGPFETVYAMLRHEENGRSVINKSIEDQRRLLNRKQLDPNVFQQNNLPAFIESITDYFLNAFIPLLDGTSVRYRDAAREEIEGSIFTTEFLQREIGAMRNIHKSFQSARSARSLPAYTREHVEKMMPDKKTHGDQLIGQIIELGDVYSTMAKELLALYDLHRLWIFNGGVVNDPEIIRSSLMRQPMEPVYRKRGCPIPFYDCVLLGFPGKNLFSNEFIGMRIVEDSVTEGIFITITAFLVQAAHTCMNDRISQDLMKRKELFERMETIKKEAGIQ